MIRYFATSFVKLCCYDCNCVIAVDDEDGFFQYIDEIIEYVIELDWQVLIPDYVPKERIDCFIDNHGESCPWYCKQCSEKKIQKHY